MMSQLFGELRAQAVAVQTVAEPAEKLAQSHRGHTERRTRRIASKISAKLASSMPSCFRPAAVIV